MRLVTPSVQRSLAFSLPVHHSERSIFQPVSCDRSHWISLGCVLCVTSTTLVFPRKTWDFTDFTYSTLFVRFVFSFGFSISIGFFFWLQQTTVILLAVVYATFTSCLTFLGKIVLLQNKKEILLFRNIISFLNKNCCCSAFYHALNFVKTNSFVGGVTH